MTRTSLKTSDGLNLHLYSWPGPSEPVGTVLIVHGLGEHGGRYAALAADLQTAGWRVLSYDQRGHGASDGPRGVIPHANTLLLDLAAVIRHSRRPADPQTTGPLVLLGHSMGGAVAARFICPGRDGLVGEPAWRDAARCIDALVLSSPALQVTMNAGQRLLLAATLSTLPNLTVGNGLKPEWICRDPQVVTAYQTDPLVHDRISPRLTRFIIDAGNAVRERAAQWPTPTLLMWTRSDRCVNPQGSAALAERAPSTLLSHRSFDGLAHEIFNEPERAEVVDELLRWLKQRQGGR